MSENPITIAAVKAKLISDLLSFEITDPHTMKTEEIEQVYQSVFELLTQAQKS